MSPADMVRIALIGGAAGLLALGLGINTAGADVFATREEDEAQVVLVAADDDDDDTGNNNTDGKNTANTNSKDPTGEDGPTNSNDGTNSVRTARSRGGDASVAGLTRDMTKDGPGGLKRDWSDNRTNDASINDSGASRKTNDNTRSNYTAQSRNQDRSVADLTRDWTNDGPGKNNRDFSRNLTNDGTRNDTR